MPKKKVIPAFNSPTDRARERDKNVGYRYHAGGRQLLPIEGATRARTAMERPGGAPTHSPFEVSRYRTKDMNVGDCVSRGMCLFLSDDGEPTAADYETVNALNALDATAMRRWIKTRWGRDTKAGKRETADRGVWDETYAPVLRQMGFTVERDVSPQRLEELKKKHGGNLLLKQPRHVTAMLGGNIVDSWDSRDFILGPLGEYTLGLVAYPSGNAPGSDLVEIDDAQQQRQYNQIVAKLGPDALNRKKRIVEQAAPYSQVARDYYYPVYFGQPYEGEILDPAGWTDTQRERLMTEYEITDTGKRGRAARAARNRQILAASGLAPNWEDVDDYAADRTEQARKMIMDLSPDSRRRIEEIRAWVRNPVGVDVLGVDDLTNPPRQAIIETEIALDNTAREKRLVGDALAMTNYLAGNYNAERDWKTSFPELQEYIDQAYEELNRSRHPDTGSVSDSDLIIGHMMITQADALSEAARERQRDIKFGAVSADQFSAASRMRGWGKKLFDEGKRRQISLDIQARIRAQEDRERAAREALEPNKPDVPALTLRPYTTQLGFGEIDPPKPRKRKSKSVFRRPARQPTLFAIPAGGSKTTLIDTKPRRRREKVVS